MSSEAKTVLCIGGVLALTLVTYRVIAGGHPRLLVVALLGDSITAAPQYRPYLEELLGPGNIVEAFGYPGQSTPYIANQADEAMNGDPTDLVVLAGVNDIASGRSLDATIQELEDIYLLAQIRGIRVTAVLLTPWAGHVLGKKSSMQDKTAELNDWIRFMSSANRVVDTQSLGDSAGRLRPEYDRGDGLHMSPEGQRALAALVYRKLR